MSRISPSLLFMALAALAAPRSSPGCPGLSGGPGGTPPAPPPAGIGDVAAGMAASREKISDFHIIYSNVIDSANSPDFRSDSAISRGYMREFAFKGETIGLRNQSIDLGYRPNRSIPPRTFLDDRTYVKWWPEHRLARVRSVPDSARRGAEFVRDDPWLQAISFWPSRSHAPTELKAFYLPGAFADHDYRLLQAPEEVDGFPCVVVERPGKDKVWIDAGYGFAVRRRRWRAEASGGEPEKLYLYESRDFREERPGVWLPWRTHITVSVPPESGSPSFEPAMISQLLVGSLEVNGVEDRSLRPEYLPGTIVTTEATGSEAESVEILAGGEDLLDEWVARAGRRFKGRPAPGPADGLVTASLLVGPWALVLVGVSLTLAARRRGEAGGTWSGDG